MKNPIYEHFVHPSEFVPSTGESSSAPIGKENTRVSFNGLSIDDMRNNPCLNPNLNQISAKILAAQQLSKDSGKYQEIAQKVGKFANSKPLPKAFT